MSAKNMSDEELDNLFRKSAEMHSPPFDQEAWEAMDRKLDDVQGRPFGFKRIVLPVLLIALLISVFLIWRNYNTHEPSITVGPASQNSIVSLSKAGPKEREKEIENTPLSEPLPGTIQHPGARSGSGKASSELMQTGANVIYKASENATVKVGGFEPQTGIEADALELRPVLPAQVFEGDTAHSQHTNLLVPGIPESAIVISDTAKRITQSGPAILADSTRKAVKQSGVFLKNVTVVLAAAPDFTTVRFKNADAVSTNAGLLVNLPLTNRFSIVSGAVWANKLYSAAPQDYEPYADFWNGKPLPDVITAECKVLDIPVNLQYRILEKGKNKLTIEAGLSSYIMLNEKYTYTYSHPGSNPYSKTREVNNENRHWFGVQNLAVGYARTLSPVLSVGVQPFVKMPLEGIGAGHVKLTSAGVFFTVGYTLKPKY